MKVAVRIRPFKNSEVKSEGKFEGKSNLRNIIRVTDDNLIFDPLEVKRGFYFHGKKQIRRDVTVVNKNLSFKFDEVFDDGAQNRDVFERLMKPLVHTLMDGLNCSFINYGASGTGKTHTILGNSKERGIAYLTMEYVFFQLNKRLSNEWIYDISVSYLEVYNEKVVNLLTKSRPLTIMDKENGEIKVNGLHMKKVNNLTEVQKLLALGNRNRTKHFSNANAHSKQSNAIFQVHISLPNQSFNGDSTVKLLVAELGGSERNPSEEIHRNSSMAAANISKSILTLKNCLHRLADGSKDIPFKESKLTKILKNSFDSNCSTVMLFNVTSSDVNYGDTYNTLTYANRALQIGKTTEQLVIVPPVQQHCSIGNTALLKRNNSYIISTTRPPIRTNENKTVYTESTRKVQSIKQGNDLKHKTIAERISLENSTELTELTELTRWYYEIGTIYDSVKTAIEGYCTTISKEKLLELRMRCREEVEQCRTFLLSGRSNRMAKVRVKSVLEEITTEIKVLPSKINYWKSRLQICYSQLINLHRKVKKSNFDHLLEPFISMKEFGITATKAHHESMHVMKINAIYVNKTEIDSYLSVLGEDLESDDMLEAYDELQSSEVSAFADIMIPLYKNCLSGPSSKNNSQTKCNRANSRTSISSWA